MDAPTGPWRASGPHRGPAFFTILALSAAALLVSAWPVSGQTTGFGRVLEDAGSVRWCLGLSAGLAHGGVEAGPVRTRSDGSPCREVAPSAGASQAVGLNEVSPGKAFLYSAVIPGAGQRLLGQGRWVPYLAVEVWSWIQFYLRRTQGQDLQQEYRDLAWEVARRVSVGSREDGDFPYYESLTQFRASGAFDQDPLTAGIQPETDPETFNGELWELAGQIFFPPDADTPPPVGSPEYERALEYYVERSVTPRFAWSWADSELQQAAFSQLIEESDEELRSSTTMIGVILANHFVSAVDALISARLRSLGRSGDEIDISTFPPGPDHRWGILVKVRP